MKMGGGWEDRKMGGFQSGPTERGSVTRSNADSLESAEEQDAFLYDERCSEPPCVLLLITLLRVTDPRSAAERFLDDAFSSHQHDMDDTDCSSPSEFGPFHTSCI